jgi:hypothetical protein
MADKASKLGECNEMLVSNVDNLFVSTSESCSDNRLYAWCHYCLWRYGEIVPSLLQTLEDWPPT